MRLTSSNPHIWELNCVQDRFWIGVLPRKLGVLTAVEWLVSSPAKPPDAACLRPSYTSSEVTRHTSPRRGGRPHRVHEPRVAKVRVCPPHVRLTSRSVPQLSHHCQGAIRLQVCLIFARIRNLDNETTCSYARKRPREFLHRQRKVLWDRGVWDVRSPVGGLS